MARSRRKKSLYEVIGKSQLKSSYDKTLGQLRPEESGKDEPVAADTTTQRPERATRWPKRPRIIQFNAGRIELSVPYQLAIALLLGIVLLILIFFRLGQISYLSKHKPIDSSGKLPKNVKEVGPQAKNGTTQTSNVTEKTLLNAGKTSTKSKGNNRIVIQAFKFKADLEPVQRYFAQRGIGIETEIRKIGDWYYLVTKDKYEDPEKKGTDGYIARQDIIEWGAKYKAPQGYETFAPNFFSDAYGMKFDD